MRVVGRVAMGMAVLVSAVLLGLVGDADAGCVGPVIGIGAPRDNPGTSPAPVAVDRTAEIEVAGRWFRDGCSDTFVKPACGPPRPLEAATPQTDIDLILTQGATRWTLGQADAGPEPDYATTWRVRIPDDAEPGPAMLSAQGTELPIVITEG